MDGEFLRRLVDAQHRVVVEVVLFDGSILDRDLAEESVAQAVDDATLHLGADAVGVDGEAAVDHAADLVDRQLILIVKRDVGDDRYVAQEAPVGSDADAPAFHPPILFRLLVPAELLRRSLHHGPQPSRVGRERADDRVHSPTVALVRHVDGLERQLVVAVLLDAPK